MDAPDRRTAPRALAGVRVLDLSQGIAGPFAARLLGDFGAEVIKVEPPEGDSARRLAPLKTDAPADEQSLLFQYLNWNKRGIVLDFETLAGRASLQALVRASDIVIESFRPGVLMQWGLAPAKMLEGNPRLVVTSVTDFGQAGPYAGYRGSDLVHQAMSGIMQISGQADREPLKHGLSQAYFCAGLNAAYATLATHAAAVADGIGDHVDLSVHECLASELVMCESYYSFMGAVQGRRLAVQDPFAGAPIPTRRGYVAIQSGGPTPLEVYADLFRNEAFRDPKYANHIERAQHVDEVRRQIELSVRDRDAKEIFLEGSKRRLLVGMVQGADDLLACEQLAARGFFAELLHPATGRFRFPVELVKLSATPTAVRRRSPLLGEHTAEVLAALPPAGAEDVRPRADAAPASGKAKPTLPLEGLRVLDLSTVVAVPYMAGLLADLGAEVIKIEAPHKLDQTRRGVFTTYLDDDRSEDAVNRSGIFQVLNRGKQSMVLDMSRPEGREVFRALVAKSDIVVENYTPRVMRSWDLHYDALRRIKPSLIMLSNTGYGASGPWSGFPSQGTTLEATMGITSYTGYRGDKPWKAGQSYPDFLACWTGLTALFAALHHLRATNEGQAIDLGMYQVGAALIPEPLLQVQLDGRDLERIGNEDAVHVPSNAYRALGDDRWVALTVVSDAQWQALCALMARDGLVPDPRHASAAGRREHRGEVNAWVGGWTQRHDARELMALLQAQGIACGPVFDNRDLLLDAHLAARGFHERVAHPAPMGVRPIMGRPWKLLRREIRVRKPAPRYGEDNRRILCETLGMDAQRAEDLIASCVVCDQPHTSTPIDSMGLPALQRLKSVHELDADYREKLGLVPQPSGGTKG
ncbi:Succinyl-CoA:(R)-benzylsuccinate CoA-transferase subunit BbsF (plasmid) [Variovorax sp. SRS16]|uniref:CaiB/BaiF CoA transferase family protein n=1 Tax=Variovorax sp. SRS16 TaxID=282217 RepID=UPI001318FBB6|nr:CoA transferase [Variovorax sp. SRS16]VTU45629.1 Succinyl-CoA:(R)-benzylsuccinate CoA-transferase subunit BbsF [Variovorax sp. SRS16]